MKILNWGSDGFLIAFPYIIRPILRVLKFVPKIILQSPSSSRGNFEEECSFFSPLGKLDRSECSLSSYFLSIKIAFLNDLEELGDKEFLV